MPRHHGLEALGVHLTASDITVLLPGPTIGAPHLFNPIAVVAEEVSVPLLLRGRHDHGALFSLFLIFIIFLLFFYFLPRRCAGAALFFICFYMFLFFYYYVFMFFILFLFFICFYYVFYI